MRAASDIAILFAVAIHLVFFAAMPAKACTMPCCRHAAMEQEAAGCDGCGLVKLSSPQARCCGMASRAASESATLNTGAPAHQALTLTAGVSRAPGHVHVPAVPAKPGFAFGTFKSPPVFKLASNYRC